MKKYDMKYTIQVSDDFNQGWFNDILVEHITNGGGEITGYLEESPKTKWEAIKNLLADLWLVIRWGI